MPNEPNGLMKAASRLPCNSACEPHGGRAAPGRLWGGRDGTGLFVAGEAGQKLVRTFR